MRYLLQAGPEGPGPELIVDGVQLLHVATKHVVVVVLGEDISSSY